MKVFKNKNDLCYFIDNERFKGNKIGFVPTMGALHRGHLALVNYAIKENHLCVCSIFVNPTQFNNSEDLLKYPRTLEDDLNLLEKVGCHVVYIPELDEIYDDPTALRTTINFGEIESILEGQYRPGHFRGVGLVVTKFFNIIKPNTTYFGQKDLQQFYLIKQLIRDFSYDIQLVCVPTLREKDGLAYSSRNERIKSEYRSIANKFYECLVQSRDLLKKGLNMKKIKEFANTYIGQYPPLQLEYLELVDTEDFQIIDKIRNENQTALCIAGYVNNIRLIDNVLYI